MNIIDSNTSFFPLIQQQNRELEKIKDHGKQELKVACQQFESIFLNHILKSMRATVPDGGLFEKSVAFDIVQSMHDEALAEQVSLNGGIGLANQIYEQLSRYV